MKMVLKLNRMLVAGILSFTSLAVSAQENPTNIVKKFFFSCQDCPRPFGCEEGVECESGWL